MFDWFAGFVHARRRHRADQTASDTALLRIIAEHNEADARAKPPISPERVAPRDVSPYRTYWLDGREHRYLVGSIALGRTHLSFDGTTLNCWSDPPTNLLPDDGMPYFVDDENGERQVVYPSLSDSRYNSLSWI